MWISRQEFEEQRAMSIASNNRAVREYERAKVVEAESKVLNEQNRVLQVQLDFMRVRINQLEKERAELLYKFCDVKIAVPEILPVSTSNGYDEMPSFEDVGEEEAARLGITHDDAGNLIYTK